MSPSFIKRLLEKHVHFNRNNMPIVVISDMQNRTVLELLKQDSEIGPRLIIPALDFKEQGNVTTDFFVAANSAYFVGTRLSTMAIKIALARFVTGKDPNTNLVCLDNDLNVFDDYIYSWNDGHERRKHSTNDGSYEKSDSASSSGYDSKATAFVLSPSAAGEYITMKEVVVEKRSYTQQVLNLKCNR